MTPHPGLQIDDDDGVRTITLDRPEQRNTIDLELMASLTDVMHAANDDASIGAIVLTGADTAFSAGGDVRQMAEQSGIFQEGAARVAEHYRTSIQALQRAILASELPLIAAVNGPAIGAGFDLALSCDLRLASTSARFGATFINLGLIPGDGGTWLLASRLGEQRAFELVMTGRVIDAEDALAIGAVLSLHQPDALLAAAGEMARTIADKPRLAARYAKRLLRDDHEAGRFLASMSRAADIQALLHGTAEHQRLAQEMLDRISSRAAAGTRGG